MTSRTKGQTLLLIFGLVGFLIYIYFTTSLSTIGHCSSPGGGSGSAPRTRNPGFKRILLDGTHDVDFKKSLHVSPCRIEGSMALLKLYTKEKLIIEQGQYS